MITSLLVNVLLAPILLLLSAIVPVSLPSIPQSWFDNVISLIASLHAIVPVKELVAILAISFGLNNLKLFWTIFLRIKSLIPTWGN